MSTYTINVAKTSGKTFDNKPRSVHWCRVSAGNMAESAHALRRQLLLSFPESDYQMTIQRHISYTESLENT